MMVTFVLAGPHRGKGIKLGNYTFKNGKYSANLQGSEVESLSKLMSFWQAYPEGSKELAQANETQEVESGSGEISDEEGSNDSEMGADEPTAQEGATGDGNAEAQGGGEGVQDTDPDGRQEAPVGAPVNERLRHILASMDPANDEHWTQGGLPRLAVVEEAYGSTDITREDVKHAYPGWNREASAAQAKELAEI